MTVLRFKQDATGALSNMVAFSECHQRYSAYMQGEETSSGLWLIKDDGIYLMSPTRQTFDNGNRGRRCNLNVVVYAKGYKPTKGNADTLWDKTHAVSRDDFVEFVALNKDQVDHILAGADIKIKLTTNTMVVSTERTEKE